MKTHPSGNTVSLCTNRYGQSGPFLQLADREDLLDRWPCDLTATHDRLRQAVAMPTSVVESAFVVVDANFIHVETKVRTPLAFMMALSYRPLLPELVDDLAALLPDGWGGSRSVRLLNVPAHTHGLSASPLPGVPES